MTKIFRGRFTAQIDGPFVVFIIGMRVNKLMMIGKWLPVARAMGLAAAAEHVPAIGARETARRRLGFKGEPAVASYENPGQP
jgi:hypothetical protein